MRSLKGSIAPIDAVDVIAVLVVWGPGCPSLPEGHVALERVELFSGQHETSWRDWLDKPRLDSDHAAAIGAAMSSFDAAHAPAI